MEEYVTIQGDTWDMIAYKVYGDELKADVLMQANPRLLDYVVFPACITLQCPAIEVETDFDTAEEWRLEDE